MTDEQIKRINELAKLQKDRGLTPEEIEEQKNLREQFIKDMKNQVTTQLDQAGYTRKTKH